MTNLILILSLLVILQGIQKATLSDDELPIGNYLSYIMNQCTSWLKGLVKIKLPLKVRNDDNTEIWILKDWSLGDWLYDMLNCFACLSVWICWICFWQLGIGFMVLILLYFIILKKILAKL